MRYSFFYKEGGKPGEVEGDITVDINLNTEDGRAREFFRNGLAGMFDATSSYLETVSDDRDKDKED